MKKLMIAFAAVAMAACAHAAAAQWAVGNQGTYKGWTAHLYKGSSESVATVLATVLAEDAAPKGWTDNLYAVTGTGTTTGTLSGRGATTPAGVTGVADETWTVVLMNGGFEDGTQYAVMENYNVADYKFNDGDSPKTMSFTSITATGTLKVESVPEPTSGLLLLLGVAGLALRRRRS